MRRFYISLATALLATGTGFVACVSNTNPANSPQDAGPCTIAITAGEKHTCALASGEVRCWGDDTVGQLGSLPPTGSSPTTSDTPGPAVQGFTAPVASIAAAAGGEFTCALLTTGAVECWGADYSGQLGARGTSAFQATPTPVALALDAEAVAVGSLSTLR